LPVGRTGVQSGDNEKTLGGAEVRSPFVGRWPAPGIASPAARGARHPAHADGRCCLPAPGGAGEREALAETLPYPARVRCLLPVCQQMEVTPRAEGRVPRGPGLCYTGDRMGEKYFIITMGCQMNQRDSETLAGILQGLGYARAEGPAAADVILLNTCAVREKPERKVFSLLGEMARHKRRRPGTIIGVCGCVAQASAAAIRTGAPQVDLILGPRNYAELPALLAERRARPPCTGETPVPPEGEGGLEARPTRTGGDAVDGDRCIPEGLPAARESCLTAYVNVTYGCDNYCAYCIVPYARGPLQSREPEAVLEEVRRLVDAGYRQITLLGQNVNAYGQDLGGGWTSRSWLCRVDEVCRGQRVRFTTSHPQDVPPRLIAAMRDLPSVCEWLHLPLQAGDDVVLERMGRGYTARVPGPGSAGAGGDTGVDAVHGRDGRLPGETEEQLRALTD